MPTYSYTVWPSLYDTARHESVSDDWDSLCGKFMVHRALTAKDLGPGFGPYRLKGPDSRRRDLDVAAVTLAVFDVDIGTADDVAASAHSIAGDGLISLWYTTFSHRPDQPSLRLVLPLSRPVTVDEWPILRAQILVRHSIPADPKKCSGASHFYFLPSHPLDAPAGSYWVECAEAGVPLPVDDFDLRLKARSRPTFSAPAVTELPTATAPVDLRPLREALESRARSLGLRHDAASKEKARLLRAALAGEPLAEHGSRNESAARTAGILAWSLPQVPVSVLMELLRPSVDAMISEGSSLTHTAVERMLESAARKKAEVDAESESFQEELLKWYQGDLAARGVVPSRKT